MRFIQIGNKAFNIVNILHFELSFDTIWVEESNKEIINVRFENPQDAAECFKRVLAELNKEDK